VTPAAVRKAIGQEYFSVVCDSCHGKMYVEYMLCAKCHGEGRVVIAERTVRAPISENGKLVIILAMAIAFGVVTVLAILM
jgi:DnaJ-class molecular chaperone